MLQQHDPTLPYPTPSPKSRPSAGFPAHLRHAAREVEPAEMLRARDRVSKNSSISRDKLNDVWRETSFQEDLVHGEVGQHGGIAGFPEDHISLEEEAEQIN